MSWLFETLVARTVLVLLLGIAAVQGMSLWYYEAALNSEAVLANDQRLADRLIVIYRAAARVAPPEREAVLHELAGGVIEAHWGLQRRATADPQVQINWSGLREILVASVPQWAGAGLVIGKDPASPGNVHLVAVGMQLPDDSWLNIDLLTPVARPTRSDKLVLGTTLAALAVVLVTTMVIRCLIRPLQLFASAARNLYASADTIPVPEVGSREMRTLARAFNEMQDRIRRLVAARTRALAAVSHDLKAPLTRLRIRADDIGSTETRIAVEADLAEMERMIDATLTYLRGDRSDEETLAVDLMAIIETIANEAQDLGGKTTVRGPRSLVVAGRYLALRRALTNVVDNAIRYGKRADIDVTADAGSAVIVVTDSGPGIPDQCIEAIFEPFVRLEPSRNHATGGIGLGLTIANEIFRSHGGAIDAFNVSTGGLRVVMRLPIGRSQALSLPAADGRF